MKLQDILKIKETSECIVHHELTEDWKNCYYQYNSSHFLLMDGVVSKFEEKYNESGWGALDYDHESVFDPTQEVFEDSSLSTVFKRDYTSAEFIKFLKVKIKEYLSLDESKGYEEFDDFINWIGVSGHYAVQDLFEKIGCKKYEITLEQPDDEYLWFSHYEKFGQYDYIWIEEIKTDIKSVKKLKNSKEKKTLKKNKEIKNKISALINELLNSDNFTLEKFKSSIPQILLKISSEEFIEILTKDNRDFVDNSNGEIVENKDLINLTREHFDKNEDLNSEEFIENMSKTFFENLKSENDSTNTHDDEFLSYYENGEIKEKGYYKNGEKNGVFYYFSENGKILKEILYVNGLLDGESKYYYESSQLKDKMSFKNGNLKLHRSYYENGNIKSQFVELPSDKSKWVFQCYSENGKLIKSDIVKDIHELKEKTGDGELIQSDITKDIHEIKEKIIKTDNKSTGEEESIRREHIDNIDFEEIKKAVEQQMVENSVIKNSNIQKPKKVQHSWDSVNQGGCLVVILFLLSLTLSLII
jgi:antitoxin component YwqK of YwqJK toxin-antitoxin module